MSRRSKMEVAALNLRIPRRNKRNYARLLGAIWAKKKGYRVFGDTHVALFSFDEQTSTGSFAKYTQIELNGDWFDEKNFDVADPKDLDKLVIPENLKPNLSFFYFILKEDIHTIAFETYSESKSLSLDAVRKFFRLTLSEVDIVQEFGVVEATIVSSAQATRKLLQLPNIREVRIAIRRPNPDDVGDDLARVIEERLKKQKADEYEEGLKAGPRGAIKPDQRTKKLAAVASENGDVTVKSIVNGVMVVHHATQTPLKEVETFPTSEAALPHFRALAERLFQVIARTRRLFRG